MLLLCEKFLWGRLLDRAPTVLCHLYTIVIFVFGWSFFWITDGTTLLRFWKALAFGYGLTGTSSFWELTVWEYWPVFLVCAVASTPLIPFLKERFLAWVEQREAVSVMIDGIANPRCVEASSLCTLEAHIETKSRTALFRIVSLSRDLLLVILFLACMASIVSGSFNPFIYFQF